MNDLWGNKFMGGKQLYCEMWEMGITLPHHFLLLIKLGNYILKKTILKKRLESDQLLRFALEHLKVPDPTESSYV